MLFAKLQCSLNNILFSPKNILMYFYNVVINTVRETRYLIVYVRMFLVINIKHKQ